MKKFDNFCAALHNLKDIYAYKEPYDNVVLTGMIKDEQTREQYYDMFVSLQKEIQDKWL